MLRYFIIVVGLAICCFIIPSISYAQTDLNIPIKGICIYIDYPDAPKSISEEELNGLLNDMDYETDEVNRSFRRYWYQESRRNWDFEHDIFYYTAPLPSTHYAGLQWFESIQLWKDAMESIIANNPDYDWDAVSTFNEDDPWSKERPGDFSGAFKSVMVISSVWGPAGLGGAHFPNWGLSNGKTVGTIQGAVLNSPWDEATNLFVLCHEAGHTVFNLPDTYDYDASSGGTAKYSLMSAQGPDIEPVGGPFVYQHGWGTIKEPGPGTHTFVLPADGDTIVVVKNFHDEREFFTLEARKQSTLGNSLFSAPLGLVIWHSDLKVHTGNNLENRTKYSHYRHSIEQRDGLFELEDSSSPIINIGDIYLEGNEFTDNTWPDSKWWAGESSGIEVKDIVFLDEETIQVTVVVPEIHDDHREVVPTENWEVLYETPSQIGYDATKAFDKDPQTYYHVNGGDNEPRPHIIEVDMGELYDINEFYYTANDNYSSPWEGRVKDYILEFSEDGDEWETTALVEEFFVTPFRQYELFQSERARYFRFSVYSSSSNDARTSVAELEFRGTIADPNSVIENTHDINISPNPATGLVNVEGLLIKHSIQVYTSTGTFLQEIQQTSKSTTVDISDFPNGILIVKIVDEHGQLVLAKKVLKVR